MLQPEHRVRDLNAGPHLLMSATNRVNALDFEFIFKLVLYFVLQECFTFPTVDLHCSRRTPGRAPGLRTYIPKHDRWEHQGYLRKCLNKTDNGSEHYWFTTGANLVVLRLTNAHTRKCTHKNVISVTLKCYFLTSNFQDYLSSQLSETWWNEEIEGAFINVDPGVWQMPRALFQDDASHGGAFITNYTSQEVNGVMR